MKIGTTLGLLSPKYYEDVALAAERLGYESLWLPEHLVFPTQIEGSPYPGMDHSGVTPNIKLFDPFAFLSYLAGKTERIRLGTNVYLMGLRHPFVAARAVATLDWVSKGRAEVGIGAGWLTKEWEVAGLDPRTRGKRLDEALAVCKRLWTEQVIEHRGEFYQFDPVMFEPKPVQSPYPPLHIGGQAPAALRRVVESADGWLGIGHSLESAEPIIAELKRLCDKAGRDFGELEIITSGGVNSREDVARWEALGVTRLIVQPWQAGRDAVAGLEDFAARIL